MWGARGPKRIRSQGSLHNPSLKGYISFEDFTYPRMEVESGQLVSYEGPGRGERTIMGMRMVGGSFLKDIPLTSAVNALH